MANLWDYENPINTYEHEDHETPDVPAWIEQDISPSDVAAIVQGGCGSGAYMAAVRYHDAVRTMNDHGDDVLQYLEDYGALECMDLKQAASGSWAGLAVYFLSAAVEQWASVAEDELDTLLDAIEEDEEDEEAARE